MSEVIPKDFTFNASALGVGGVLQYADRSVVVPSLASVALPPTGGEGSSLVENYCRDGLSFTRAETRVTGYPVGPGATHTTMCDILITNLNLFDTLRVAMMTATLTSTHLTPDETRFELRAIYRGVQIGDDEIVPEYDVELSACPTYELFGRKVKADLRAYSTNFDVPAKTLERAVDAQQPLHGSIVSNLRGAEKSLTERKSHKLVVPGFGKLHFGELLVKPGRRRLNLLRVEFGNKGILEGPPSSGPIGGAMTLGSGDGNGVPIWP